MLSFSTKRFRPIGLLLLSIGLSAAPARAQRPASAPPGAYPQPTPAQKAARDSLFAWNKAENDALFKSFSAQVTVQTGYAAARFAPLNPVFQQAGYPTLGAGQLATGGSFTVRVSRIMFGIEGLFYDDDKVENNRKTEVYSSNALMKLGYYFFSPSYDHAFIPSVGLGLATADFTLTDQSTATNASVSGLLGGLNRPATVLHYRSTNLNLGLGYEYYPFGEGDTRRRGVIGLHLDYLARIGEGKYYTYDFKQPIAGPAIDPLRFRASVVLGFLF